MCELESKVENVRTLKLEDEAEKFSLRLVSKSSSPSSDVHLTTVDILRFGCEEAIIDHEVVHLRNLLCQRVMLPQEGQQLLARTIDSQLLGQEILVLQHVLEENFPEPTSLTRLVDVEVQDARCVDMLGVAVFVEHVERLAPNFEKTDNESAGKNCKTQSQSRRF